MALDIRQRKTKHGDRRIDPNTEAESSIGSTEAPLKKWGDYRGMELAARRAREHFRDSMTEVIAVRGISDLCNKKTDDVFRKLAADHAAAFLTGFLKSGYDPEF